MGDITAFVLRIVGASILVAVVGSFPLRNSARQLIRMISGVFLTITLLTPVLNLDLELPALSDLALQGEVLAGHGQTIAADMEAAIIKERAEAYIIEKAASLKGDVTAFVELNEENVPVSVTLQGNLAPYGRQRLTQYITDDLGIHKEHQQWTNP